MIVLDRRREGGIERRKKGEGRRLEERKRREGQALN